MIDYNIEELLKDLKKQKSSETVFNQYGDNASIPLFNLQIYLTIASCFRINSLFVDLSPGYKNCVITGIPLTNEFILFNNQISSPLFGFRNGYKENLPNKKATDLSTALFWTDLNIIDRTPLLWNCYPFHCHLKNDPQSNRHPTEDEIQTGMVFLLNLLEIFRPRKIFAIGRTVSEILSMRNIRNTQLEHPFILGYLINTGRWYSLN